MQKLFHLVTSILLIFLCTTPVYANYEKGLEALTKNDFATAIKEWTPLANQGDANLQSTIAVLYHTGQGVKQSYKDAFYWYEKAAKQGISAAQANLGVMYAKGTGTKQDFVQSYAWYSLAADTLSLDKVGSALWGIDYLASQMSAQQLDAGKKLFKEYQKKYTTKKP